MSAVARGPLRLVVVLVALCAIPALAGARPARGHRAARRHHHHRRHTVVTTPAAAKAYPVSCGGTDPTAPSVIAADQADARRLLESVNLPAGTVATATDASDPAYDFAGHTVDCQASPDISGDVSFFRSSQSLGSVLAYVEAHAPTGGTLGFQELGGSEVDSEIRYTFSPVTDLSPQRLMTIEGTPLPGGGSAFDVMSGVVWQIERPASEVVPSGVSSVEIEVTQGEQVIQQAEVTNPQQVAQLIDITNALPAQTPAGTPCSGGADDPATAVATTVAFLGAAGNTLASATPSGVDGGACGGVGFTVGSDASEPTLADPQAQYYDYVRSYLPSS